MSEPQFVVLKAAGEREAEDQVDEALKKFPAAALQVFIQDKLAYNVWGPEHPSSQTQKKSPKKS